MEEQLITFFIQERPAVLAFGITLAVFYLAKAFLLARLDALAAKTKNDVDDLVINVLQSIRLPFAAAVGVFVATFFTALITIRETPWLHVLLILIVTYQVGRFVHVLFRWTKREMAEAGTHVISGFRTILILLVWAVGLVFALSALGYDVTSLVAGLGIGGLAVALALQNILGDIFSSVSIYFDKPFSVGDYIQVGDKDGVVEQIGMKTTRLRSLRGELIVIANKDLTNAVVQNFGALERRRVLMSIGLTYSTPNEQIDRMRADIAAMINDQNNLSFDRFFFKSFGDSALLLELVFYVESNDYQAYVNAQHEVNLLIKQYIEERDISMAFPTRTIHLER